MGVTKALFYTDKYYFLDNFSAFSIIWKGKIWPTVEHAYQAEKFTNKKIRKRILEARSPLESKNIAHEEEVLPFVRENWESCKVEVMRQLLRSKIEQHPYIQRKLLETENLLLVENSPTDSFWGRGKNWKGKNTLGKLWMELREECKK